VTTFDDELRAHNAQLRSATAIRSGDDVLDIGCGSGQTTRDAARAAAPGRVLGVDVSAPALERARELSAAEGIDNVSYEHGDAQVHRFDHDRFDVAISRFGMMFFSDPVTAFANVAGALRAGGRLVMLVWQRREDNEWAVEIGRAVGGEEPSPFSLGDPRVAEQVLERAGFRDVRFDDVHEPMFFGNDVPEALDWVSGFSDVAEALEGGDSRLVERLTETLDAHWSAARGVLFDSRAWLVRARRG
jgi:ubiquinone/menaquinone biosynthesis C-methylase UbiE